MPEYIRNSSSLWIGERISFHIAMSDRMNSTSESSPAIKRERFLLLSVPKPSWSVFHELTESTKTPSQSKTTQRHTSLMYRPMSASLKAFAYQQRLGQWHEATGPSTVIRFFNFRPCCTQGRCRS